MVDGKPPLLTDNTTANLGVPRNPAIIAYLPETQPDEFGYIVNPTVKPRQLDLGVGNFLRSPENANGGRLWRRCSTVGFRVPTLRNVDKRPRPDFVKAYGHNGYFKKPQGDRSLVRYKRRAAEMRGRAIQARKVSCWPAPNSTEPECALLQSRPFGSTGGRHCLLPQDAY